MATKTNTPGNKPAKKAARKTSATRAVKKTASKVPAKKAVKKASPKKAFAKRPAAKKSVKSPVKKAAVKSVPKKGIVKASATLQRSTKTESSSKSSGIAGKTFLFTGTLTGMQRKEAEAMVKANGGTILSGVSDKLNYLVVGEDAGSKLAKAKYLKTIKILNEKEFAALVSGENEAGKVKSGEKNLKAVKKPVFKGENPLDVKIAKKSINDYVNFDEYDSIDAKAAAILAGQDSRLYLDGIKHLDVDAAIALARHEGENSLSLNGLMELDEDVAGALSSHNGPLSFNFIRSLSSEAIKQIAKCQFDISLDGLEELEDASGFSNHTARLSLSGLKSISDKAAGQLCKKQGVLELNYDYESSIKSLTPSIARLLVKCCQDGPINLDNIEELSPDSAKELAKHNGSVSLGLKDISTEILAILNKVDLQIDNVSSLAAEQSKTISTYKKGISLNGLTNIDTKEAEDLVKVGTKLELLGVESISDQVARILASYKGILHLGCKKLSEKSAQYLGEVKRKKGENELHLPEIKRIEDVEGEGPNYLMKDGIVIFRYFPMLDFNAERVVGLCYALKGGVDYAWEIDPETWESVKEDNEEFGTFREIAKMGQRNMGDEWIQHFPDSLKRSLEFYSQLAETCIVLPKEFINLADNSIKANKELMVQFLKPYYSNYSILNLVDKKLQNDKDFVLKAIEAYPDNFEFASDKLKDDNDVINCLLTKKDALYLILHASDRIKADSEIAKAVLSKSGRCLEYFNDKIKNDKVLVKIAVDNNADAFQYASKELLSNKEYLLSLNNTQLKYIPEKLLNDKDFVVLVIENLYQNCLITGDTLDSDSDSLLVKAFNKLKLGKDECKRLLMISDSIMYELPKELKEDLEIAKILLAKDLANIEHLPASLRKNKELKSFFENLEEKKFENISDDDLVLIAIYAGYGVVDYKNVKPFAAAVKSKDDAVRLVKNVSQAYPFLNSELKLDRQIVELALKDPENANYFPQEILTDTDFIGKLLQEERRIIMYLPGSLKKNKQIIVSVLNQGSGNVDLFEDIDKSLQSDLELIELVIKKGKDSELSCLEKLPDGIKGKREFAMRIAKKGYVLEKFRSDREIVLEALKVDQYASFDKNIQNDIRVALLSDNVWSDDDPIDENHVLKKYPNILAVKFLEAIRDTDPDNLDLRVSLIRASGYSCFSEHQIPSKDYEEDYDEYNDDDNGDDSENDED